MWVKKLRCGKILKKTGYMDLDSFGPIISKHEEYK